MTDKQKADAGKLGGSKRTKNTKLRGFGSLTVEQRKDISRKAHEARYGKKETK